MIPLFKVNMSPDASAAVAEVLASGMIGEGPKVQAFQEELGVLLDSPFVTCLNSCTSALVLALRLVQEGRDRWKQRSTRNVVSTPFTFIATNTAIRESGNTIVWAGLQPETLCSDPDSVIEKARECLPAAVVITMVGGCAPIGLDALYEELKHLGIPLVLDCAHAILTTYKGRHISHWADFACFSFQAIKHLTTGDGGALVCGDREDHLSAEKLKWFGLSREAPPGVTRLEHQMKSSAAAWGYKFHMNDISAAIGLSNIEVAKSAVAASRENARYFDELISGIPGLSSIGNPECDSSCWAYGFRVGDSNVMEVVAKFAGMGIMASPLWPLNSIHRCFPECGQGQPDVIFVPNGFWVGRNERDQIANGIAHVLGGRDD